jgi:hypothetical protein
LKRKAATGDVQAKQRQATSRVRKSRTGKSFAFAKKHEDKTQVEMAALWEGDISDRTLARALAKAGWTRKKRRTGIANAMRSNEQPS